MDYLQFDKIKDDFKTFLREAGKEIYDLLKDQQAKDRFVEEIERFMGMHEVHLLKFNELIKKAKKLKKSVKVPDNLPPGPLGWYKIPTYEPGSKDACQLWGVIFPASYEQRKPTDQELLMLYYVKLAVIYDLAYSRTFSTTKLYFDADQMVQTTAAGWGNREDVAEHIWCKMTRYEGFRPDADDIEKEYIQNALEAVRADLKLTDSEKKCDHSADFRSVMWLGQTYTFNDRQAKIIKLFWESQPQPLSEKTIAPHINTFSSNYRLIDSFRSHGEYHKAWGKMIISLGRGTYSLNRP